MLLVYKFSYSKYSEFPRRHKLENYIFAKSIWKIRTLGVRKPSTFIYLCWVTLADFLSSWSDGFSLELVWQIFPPVGLADFPSRWFGRFSLKLVWRIFHRDGLADFTQVGLADFPSRWFGRFSLKLVWRMFPRIRLADFPSS